MNDANNTAQWLLTVFEKPAKGRKHQPYRFLGTPAAVEESTAPGVILWHTMAEHQPLNGINRYEFEEQKNTDNDGSIAKLSFYSSASIVATECCSFRAILLLFLKSMMH